MILLSNEQLDRESNTSRCQKVSLSSSLVFNSENTGWNSGFWSGGAPDTEIKGIHTCRCHEVSLSSFARSLVKILVFNFENTVGNQGDPHTQVSEGLPPFLFEEGDWFLSLCFVETGWN